MRCGDCGRSTEGREWFRGDGGLLPEPDYCGPCGRSRSPAAKALEAFVARRRADGTRPCRVAL